MTAHKGLVLHVQEGNGSLFGWFNNPSSQVSAHFWISKAGALEQYLDTDLTSWAQGAGNPSYLSVETEGFVAEPLTPLQLERASELFLWVAERYSVPIVGPVAHGSSGLTPHCNLDGTPDPAWGGHSCPGGIRLGQMPAIVAGAQPPTTGGENMTSLVIGGQLHVWGVVNGKAIHWWQEIGPPAGSWHAEVMPAA